MQESADVVILGAGAAGLMAAIEAGRRGRRVLVLDHADRAGKKILISGGGRCNFTNLHTAPENFLSENPHFAKSALARYRPEEFIALVEAHGIAYHEKTLGQLFCDRSAQEIVTLLERECADAGVLINLRTRIGSVSPLHPGFLVETSAGTVRAQSLVVATGGLSIPKMGATGFGYELARQFGLRVVDPRPGLVPLVFAPVEQERWCDLAGLSVEAVMSAPGKKRPAFREKILITHRGLSGPAVLQVSSYWRAGEPVLVDLAPGREVLAPLLEAEVRRDASAAGQALRGVFPARLTERWLRFYPPADWTNAGLAAAERQMHTWSMIPTGTEGFVKAEVTVGGIDTAVLDARTMECRTVPGLYFVGEVVDVTGWLGGYNFQWAWASGVCAGRAA